MNAATNRGTPAACVLLLSVCLLQSCWLACVKQAHALQWNDYLGTNTWEPPCLAASNPNSIGFEGGRSRGRPAPPALWQQHTTLGGCGPGLPSPSTTGSTRISPPSMEAPQTTDCGPALAQTCAGTCRRTHAHHRNDTAKLSNHPPGSRKLLGDWQEAKHSHWT